MGNADWFRILMVAHRLWFVTARIDRSHERTLREGDVRELREWNLPLNQPITVRDGEVLTMIT